MHADAGGDTAGRLADPVDHVTAERHRRKRARGVARVDAGLLDVLHDSADVELGAVVQRVDVDLDGVVEEAIDEQRGSGRDDRLVLDPLEVVGHRLGVVDDLHAAPAEHVTRAHEHRIADVLRDRRWPRTWSVAVPFLGAMRPASSRILENSPRSSARSMASGVVPRIGTPASLSP